MFCPAGPPFDLDALLATEPLTAQNFYDARRTWLAPFMPLLEENFEADAAQLARAIGYADPDGEGSVNNLIRERMTTGDGKVVKEVGSRYDLLTTEQITEHNKGKAPRAHIARDTHVLDRKTGEIIAVRNMVGEQLYHTGDGLKIGHKFIAWAIRDDHPNSSLVLSLRVQQTTSEAQEFVNTAIALKKTLPGLLGTITDAALHGHHLYQLMRAGLVPVSPIAAKTKDGDTRVEKSGLYQVITHTHPGGYTCEHKIYYYGGGLCEQRPDETGRHTLIDLGSPHLRARHDRSGTRWYSEYRLTCREGLTDDEPTIELPAIRVTNTTEPSGTRGALNIPENIRLVPPGRDTYKRVYGWRNNAENDNHQRDHAKHLGRARSHGAQRQLWNEIGRALVQNGRALLLHEARAAGQSDQDPLEVAQAA